MFPSLSMDSSRCRQAIGLALLIAATIATYLPAIRGGYVWDDDAYVTDNANLPSADGLRQIWLEPRSLPQYYPMVHSTYWIEYRLWGLDPLGYHVTNVLLHALSASLVFVILCRLDVPGAAMAAGIFALHPVHVESVAWITERKNVLSGFLYLAAMLSYFSFRPPAGIQASAGVRWKYYGLAFVLFVGALLSKSVTCSLPAAILVIQWWKQGRLTWRDAWLLMPMFAIGGAAAAHTIYLEASHVGAQGPEWQFTFIERCLIAGRAVWFYAYKLFWPATLIFVYPRWQIDAGAAWQYVFPCGALGLVATLWMARRRIGRWPSAAALFFGGTLLPAMGFVNAYPMLFSFVSDHHQYLASLGVIVPCAAVASRCARSRVGETGVRLFGLAVMAVLAFASVQRCGAFTDLESLWRDTIRKNPAAWIAFNNLGNALLERGETDEAIQQFQEALRLKSDIPQAHNSLGIAFGKLGQFDKAIEHYREALRLTPDDSIARFTLGTHIKLGIALGKLGQIDDAIQHYREALRLSPESLEATNNLAWLLATSKDSRVRNGPEALKRVETLVRSSGSEHAGVLDTLAAAYAEVGRFEEAVQAARKAVELARKSQQAELAREIESHLERFRNGQPLRE